MHLVLQYLECFEHVTDVLEQQRLIQIIVNLLAQRPRLNMNATHFEDSYRAEIDCLELQKKFITSYKELLMKTEKEANRQMRDYLEKSYRLLIE